ncbi:unnamed protein product [Rotaria sordida]|uniref:Uncharacterized protein n=1 Tax=Rotaria sordida TaxID=392033 RepID=A0A814JBJ6_9BILA|nr:unnamed protein product [Rotaria sordida]CAF1287036.1 unnamed protein product [Rotaria sordida]
MESEFFEARKTESHGTLLQFEERERKLTNEIQRLRTYLLTMEEFHTTDLIAAENREKSLRNQIAQLDNSNCAQN